MSRSSAMSRPPGVAPSIAAESAALRRPSLVPRTPIAPTEERRPPVALILGDPLEIGSLKSGLIQAGAPVTTASDGPTALRLIEQRRPAVIVIDLWLPGLTGLDVLRRLRYRAPAFRAIARRRSLSRSSRRPNYGMMSSPLARWASSSGL